MWSGLIRSWENYESDLVEAMKTSTSDDISQPTLSLRYTKNPGLERWEGVESI